MPLVFAPFQRPSGSRRARRGVLLAFGLLSWTLLGSFGSAQAATQTFISTGTEQTFTVPAGVSSLHVVAVGGSGGTSSSAVAAGRAAQTTGDLAGSPGQVLYVEVAGNGQSSDSGGAGGFNGGGGGGGGGGWAERGAVA
jgi:hypothetical protein